MGWADRIVHRHFIRGLALYAGLIGIAWCALFPIIWALSGSLKADGEVTEPTLFPSHPQWSNYREVFALMPFWRMFFNTVLYAGCVTAGQVFFCSLAGYAFARLQFRGRDTLFVLYLSTFDGAVDGDRHPTVHSHADRGVGGYAVGDDRAGIVR